MEKKKLGVVGETNPLTRMINGESVPDLPRPMKKVAKIGNLYHEYVKDTSLQRKGVKAIHVAEVLADLNLITVDHSTGLYAWKAEPISKQEFLDITNRAPKVKAAGQ